MDKAMLCLVIFIVGLVIALLVGGLCWKLFGEDFKRKHPGYINLVGLIFQGPALVILFITIFIIAAVLD